MEVRIHLIKRFAKAIQARNRRATRPFVARLELGAEIRHSSGNTRAKRVSRSGLQYVAQRVVRFIDRDQGAGHGIKRGELGVAFQLLSKRHPRSPGAGSAAVVGKSFGEVILKVIRGRQSIAGQTINGDVAVVVMEAGELKDSMFADLSIRREFFMPAILQNGTAVAHKQGWKGIQLIEGRG